jgi:hypothetical protein
MAGNKREIREQISTEIEGQTYTGTLIITGTRKLNFTVEYRGLRKTDSRSWGTGAEEQQGIRVMAQVHLVSLVYEAKGHNT